MGRFLPECTAPRATRGRRAVALFRVDSSENDWWLGFVLIYLLNDVKEIMAGFHKLAFVLNVICKNL